VNAVMEFRVPLNAETRLDFQEGICSMEKITLGRHGIQRSFPKRVKVICICILDYIQVIFLLV